MNENGRTCSGMSRPRWDPVGQEGPQAALCAGESERESKLYRTETAAGVCTRGRGRATRGSQSPVRSRWRLDAEACATSRAGGGTHSDYRTQLVAGWTVLSELGPRWEGAGRLLAASSTAVEAAARDQCQPARACASPGGFQAPARVPESLPHAVWHARVGEGREQGVSAVC
jgi:hypothetical protein